ncbi:hypothetical protein ACFPPF_16370 [Xenophilus aerolatus]|nr:hypothetical protein [Xenophilus aerolatus]
METEHLLNAATLIVERNRSPNLVEAWVAWDGVTQALSLAYLTAEAPSHDDEEWCELSMAELLAEFSDVAIARTGCFLVGTHAQNGASRRVFARTPDC